MALVAGARRRGGFVVVLAVRLAVFRGACLVLFGIPVVTVGVIAIGYFIGAIARVVGCGP